MSKPSTPAAAPVCEAARPASTPAGGAPDDRQIAAQLRCPQGPLGVSFGQTMNLRNLSMIVGGLTQLDLAAKTRQTAGTSGRQANAARDTEIPAAGTPVSHGYSDAVSGPATRMLELGCGNGGLLGFILSMGAKLHYCGLEISETMVNEARAFNAPFIQAGLADYRLYDGRNLPFGDAQFDRVLSVNTVYFWDEPAALLAEICRVMKSGGLLCLSFSERGFMRSLPFAAHDFNHYEMADVQQWISDGDLPLVQLARVEQQDKAVSKDGKLVNRPFIHLLYEKQE